MSELSTRMGIRCLVIPGRAMNWQNRAQRDASMLAKKTIKREFTPLRKPTAAEYRRLSVELSQW